MIASNDCFVLFQSLFANLDSGSWNNFIRDRYSRNKSMSYIKDTLFQNNNNNQTIIKHILQQKI